MDLYKAIEERLQVLDKAVEMYKDRGRALAEAERLYRMKKASKILELKAEGTPATVCIDIANGIEEIATLRFNRDVADTMYKSIEHGINVSKLSIRVLENELQREWGQSK